MREKQSLRVKIGRRFEASAEGTLGVVALLVIFILCAIAVGLKLAGVW
jgi:hypothetical protein